MHIRIEIDISAFVYQSDPVALISHSIKSSLRRLDQGSQQLTQKCSVCICDHQGHFVGWVNLTDNGDIFNDFFLK